MKRIYHDYRQWEEYKNGMWRFTSKDERETLLSKAIEFTGDHKLYGKYMLRVIKEWKISCEHNLTDSSLNKQAWIGHAACCLAIGCPEDITREAWGHLTEQQQKLANKEADHAIREWKKNYNRKILFQTVLEFKGR